ncbi:hypothetical protein [Paenibacillus kobensis]|uniref:hypothetical protein n=1 Tax=Paenibacillus kobensis TaxID=59841 RepID=UPI000FD7519E|nr:hypothetical protein [Paenibacillus kobensis]
MQTELATTPATRSDRAPRKRSQRAFVIFLFIWVLLIASGIAGAKLYTDHMKSEMTDKINQQTTAQITQMQKQYDERLKQVETGYKDEIAVLQGKVDALNELLTFTKDNANAKTDNSNKLFSQLNDVKKQLDQLKKNLDVLK